MPTEKEKVEKEIALHQHTVQTSLGELARLMSADEFYNYLKVLFSLPF